VIQVIRGLYNRKYGKYGKIKSVVIWLIVITVVLTVGFVFSDQQASSQKNEASSKRNSVPTSANLQNSTL
jgi:hypothetical protein